MTTEKNVSDSKFFEYRIFHEFFPSGKFVAEKVLKEGVQIPKSTEKSLRKEAMDKYQRFVYQNILFVVYQDWYEGWCSCPDDVYCDCKRRKRYIENIVDEVIDNICEMVVEDYWPFLQENKRRMIYEFLWRLSDCESGYPLREAMKIAFKKN